jgi:holo-[acyl-carrier protein] synthase
MIVGLGLDTVKVERFAPLTPRALDRMFTPDEQAWCENAQGAARLQRYAARFAAKEAVAKALGTGLGEGLGWKEIAVRHGELGKPEAVLTGKALERMGSVGAARVLLSLTHEREFASAVAVLEA